MEDPRVARLFSLARAGRMSRRQLLETGLRLGLASPVILSLIEAAPKSALAMPAERASLPATSSAMQEESSGTLTVLWTSGTEDIDPHYTYSELASAVALLVYEMLLILKGDSTDEFEPMLAESWDVTGRDARSAGMADAVFGAASIKERITGEAIPSRNPVSRSCRRLR